MSIIDQDAMSAAVELVGRSGAREFEVGYLREGVPMEDADWYASAMFRGARIIVEHQRGPTEACDALARRLLQGGTCRRCGKAVQLLDGRPGCRWTRIGKSWRPGCGREIDFSIPTRAF